jgi:LysM repeat protein
MSNSTGSNVDENIKSTVKLTLSDPLGRGIDGLKYQVRDGTKIIASGMTDEQGNVKIFTSVIGTRLTVYVKRFVSDDMKPVKTFVPLTEDFNVKLLSGKIKETISLQPASGSPGAYKRKTCIAEDGDTFDKLGKQYGTNSEVLARLNGLKCDAALHQGQVVKIFAKDERGGASESIVNDGSEATTGLKGSVLDSKNTNGRNSLPPSKVEKTEDRGSNGTPKTSINLKCRQSGCIKLGMRGPLVEEVNIRLLGFGCSVTSTKPLNEFTENTEAAVKQFQRDYMCVPATGSICGDMLRAMDEFRLDFPVSLNHMKCQCGECDGFGKQRTDSESVQLYRDGKLIEGIEYPGMHRALLWLFRASLFYTSVKDKELGYSFLAISSGYRCWSNNKMNSRRTTNHMGNALDLQFKKGAASTRCTGQDLEDLRDKIFIARLGAQMRWNQKNRPALESTGDGARSWVHVDMQTYGGQFKKERYYAVTQANADGAPLMDMAKETGMLALVNCGGIPLRMPDRLKDR